MLIIHAKVFASLISGYIVLQVGSSDNANFAPIVNALSNVDNKGGNQFWENIKQENNAYVLWFIIIIIIIIHTNFKMSTITSDDTHSITGFKLKDFMTVNMGKFYRYQGSLTTPTCDESVTWTVFADPLSMSESQVCHY